MIHDEWWQCILMHTHMTHTHITYHTHTYIHTFRYLHIYYRYNIGNKYVNIQISPYNIYFPYYISIFSSPHFLGTSAAGLTYSALKDVRLAADFTGVAVQDTVAEITVQLLRQETSGHGEKTWGSHFRKCKQWGNFMGFQGISDGFLMGF